MSAASAPSVIDTLRRAVEDRDSAGLMQLYAEDATLTIIDRDHPPSSPQVIEGKAKIAAYLQDVCGRPMTHKVENAVEQGERMAFTQACRHEEGWRVFCATTAELRSGRIVKQINVQAWDG